MLIGHIDILNFEICGEVKEEFTKACLDNGLSLGMDIRKSTDQGLGPEIIEVVNNVVGVAKFIAAIVTIVGFIAKDSTRQGYVKITRRDGTKIELTGMPPEAMTQLLSDVLQEKGQSSPDETRPTKPDA